MRLIKDTFQRNSCILAPYRHSSSRNIEVFRGKCNLAEELEKTLGYPFFLTPRAVKPRRQFLNAARSLDSAQRNLPAPSNEMTKKSPTRSYGFQYRIVTPRRVIKLSEVILVGFQPQCITVVARVFLVINFGTIVKEIGSDGAGISTVV
ncbi:hypothetical protein CIHG_07087 [Coccidioides immitis H538.4]|uniref:Uncharacterized protein n=3 Tax=Coccidioides immitis TaxID=5501 RepID=A0A0J8QS72_COCIT|nr:hypothetical protein CIRG_08600 [Coccidioides immitis RMSCC 2394]KMU74073.1 hypothetical protein CISG_04002 [Coccidioides immitis RMSCC 3703]KMU89155.1 hypothetical protein CIHG_07087 [Coccidioides immitis H538.4]